MTAVLLIIAVTALSVAAFAAVGHLARIADAVEAQNSFYGIAESAQPTQEGEAA